MASIVRVVGEGKPFRYSCLPRAITTTTLLRRRGINANLQMRASDGRTAAHAWVEVDGIVVDESSTTGTAFHVAPIPGLVHT